MEIEQENSLRKKRIYLIEIFAFLIVLILGIAVYFFAKSPSRQTEFIAQSPQNGQASTPIKPVEIPKEIFIAQEDIKISYSNEKVSAEETQKLPPLVKFQTFSYNSKIGKVIEVTGSCNDFYYTIVVFKSINDYKKDPTTAKINNAIECPATRVFKTSLNLKDFNLPDGDYYFFVADQGKTGTWYNPR